VNNCEDEEFHEHLPTQMNHYFSRLQKYLYYSCCNIGDLLTADDVRAMVGTGPLPIQPIKAFPIMVVVGDAVLRID